MSVPLFHSADISSSGGKNKHQMPEESGTADLRGGGGGECSSRTEEEISQILPLELIRSQLVPPVPNHRKSAIDWLPDFAGFSWIAYGASSLVVISHFPSPLSPEETRVGPFFQQVIEPLPCATEDWCSEVKAVAWCPSLPSEGQIAVGLGNSVRIYSPDTDNALGFLCWRKTVALVQSLTVEAIEWTRSGDGLITVGIEVVLWKRKMASWEVSYKFRADIPQSIVSATWSIDGPVAAAAYPSMYSSAIKDEDLSISSSDSSRHVLICQNDDKSGFIKVELCHPQPVSMIQWRPSGFTQPKSNALHSPKDVLLTCCLDGTVRLWSEIDNGRGRKSSKDIEQKTLRRSYHVIAVIEINQCLKATLGRDIIISWGTEIHDEIRLGKVEHGSAESSNYDHIGGCEWLISLGPGLSLTFWAIHCLDDISPLRFPRVSLWKKHDLIDFCGSDLSEAKSSNSNDLPILIKAVVSRNRLFGPPVACSLLQLSPNDSVSWLQLLGPKLVAAQDAFSNLPGNEESLSYVTGGVQSQDGHKGTILQVAVHPSVCEVELAISFDSHGLLLFWSISTTFTCAIGTERLFNPSWKLLGRLISQDLSSAVEYSNLTWAPSVFNDDRFLLMGHAEGIDCFLVRVSDEENQKVICHRVFTISFSGQSFRNGSYRMFAAPLPSSCTSSFVFNKFMLFGIWTTEFRVLSWEIVMHSDDLSGSNCGCSLDAASVPNSEAFKYESSYAGRTYYITANLCSSKFPIPCTSDQVSSFAVATPDNLIPSIQGSMPSNICGTSPLYHIATGYSDGSLRLWRIPSANSAVRYSDKGHLHWELVGMLTAHKGPVSEISLSNFGDKLATICTDCSNSNSMLHIWGSMCLVGGGCFSLEEKIPLDGVAITSSWLALGNGQLLLGVCMKNELRIYSQKRFVDHKTVDTGKFVESPNWFCIAVCNTNPVIKDFLWGPKLTPVLVHEKHFSLFSQWSYGTDMNSQENFHLQCKEYNSDIYLGERVEQNSSDFDKCSISGPVTNKSNTVPEHMQLNRSDTQNSDTVQKSCRFKSQQPFHFDTNAGLYNMLRIADKMCGSLPVYHPKALLRYLYSGNWKRAYMAVEHLVGCLNSSNSSTNIRGYEPENSCFIIPEISLAQYFQETYSLNPQSKGLAWGYDVPKATSDIKFHGSSLASFPISISSPTSEKSDIRSFIETLENSCGIHPLNDMERTQLLAIVDLLGECSDPHYSSAYESFDEPGRRFWVAARFQHLYFCRKFGRLATTNELIADSCMVTWAFQSDCQDNLYNSVVSQDPSWLEMRNMGVGYWFTNSTQLRSKMEKLARSQYLQKKDPKDCALLYLALNRLQVLFGLFKISKDEKDKPLVGFLSRNFQEDKNKAAALKNAYVLLGRHQLELATAFFLLGGDSSSAVTVCAKNLGDEQLALVICRLVEGYGGPLERQLISSVLLPNAIEKGDYWLSSLLEWTLENYSQSFKNLVNSCLGLGIDISASPCNHATFSDPSIGQYCIMLASKNKLRISVGDPMAAVLSKWATLMTANTLIRCGFPLEALECMPSSSSNIEAQYQNHLLDVEKHEMKNLHPFSFDSCNWLLGDVAHGLEFHSCLKTAMHYITKLVVEHPGWQGNELVSSVVLHKELDTHHYEQQMETFTRKIRIAISTLEKKYSLKSVDIMNMILISAYCNGLIFLGYNVLHGCNYHEHVKDKQHTIDRIHLHPVIPRMLVKACKEISYFLARYTVYHNIADSILIKSRICTSDRTDCCQTHPPYASFKSFIYSIRNLRTLLKLYGPSILTAANCMKTLVVLDHLELCVCFASFWFRRNLKGLVSVIHPISSDLKNRQSFHEAIGGNIFDFLSRSTDLMIQDSSRTSLSTDCKEGQDGESGLAPLQLENEKWLIIGTSSWRQLYDFTKYQLITLMTENREDVTSKIKPIEMFHLFFAELLITALAYVFSTTKKQLLSLLWHKVKEGVTVNTLFQSEESSQPELSALHYYLNQGNDTFQLINNENQESLLSFLLEISLNSDEILNCFELNKREIPGCWIDIQRAIVAEYETESSANYNQDGRTRTSSASTETDSFHRSQTVDKESFTYGRIKDPSTLKKAAYFNTPKEVHKKSGELIEAMCFNCIDERQVALATNRRGILFFDLEVEGPIQEPAEYLWLDSDWPHDGWAGSESTPIPTFVSPGIGLGSKKGAHLGLGGATIGTGSLARPGRDLTGGGAFGIPGYAGIGAAGLGWGEHELEEFVDPPATTENTSARALSSHPSKPLFLAGSSNTHVYLWEFGKDKAIATYGVLPAANVPPPYALASISALKFDHYGHRFATAALDGTVCTWQLEVGGRSNVHPTESSLCFNDHAMDVAYMTASGSIIAAAGHSTNNVNVIIWDTLAPPLQSQASLVCHEGGVRSLSVLDNGIGNGSISPIIITGGKNGDVEMHDFRFIATGRVKRHRHSTEQNPKSSAIHDTNAWASRSGDSSNGMLWQIPKAHLGSIATISNIPNTSLFLTGSKDGDVKLWDARRSELVFHWRKLHERHTFLQPSSRGFGGVVRAAVTDVQVLSHGFLTCGGDGAVKLIQLKDIPFGI